MQCATWVEGFQRRTHTNRHSTLLSAQSGPGLAFNRVRYFVSTVQSYEISLLPTTLGKLPVPSSLPV